MALREGWRHSRGSKDESGVRAAFNSLSPGEVDGWRSPQKPEGPSGRRCEDWTRRKELLFPDAGIVVWDRRIPPDTRLAGSSPCVIARVHRDQHLVLDLAVLIRGFRAPALCDGGTGPGPALESLPRGKPRGGIGSVWRVRLWGFAGGGGLACDTVVAGGAQSWRGNRRRRTFSMAELARVCRVRSGRVRTADIAQTSRLCSGAGLEAKAIDGARRDAWRRS